MGAQTHVLVIPFPAQGHVAPLMKLAHQIADYGIKVTFVNTEFIHEKIVFALPENNEKQMMKLVSIPDGLGPEDDRNNAFKLTESILRVMPGHLRALIENINMLGKEEEITCVIADLSFGWALEVVGEMGIKQTGFCPFSPSALALSLQIPNLIEAGIIDENGIPLENGLIRLSIDLPPWNSNELTWSCPGDLTTQKVFFNYTSSISQAAKLSNWILCNSSYEIDPSAFDLIPNVLPIGPLLASNVISHHAGSLWPEDSTCLSWLDTQPTGSVVYVAFRSFTIFSKKQVEELALGLEKTGRPFLWVVMSELSYGKIVEYPEGYVERVAKFGKIVEWAPQEKVLAHPSIACFLSHCGWNSTIEALTMGVPFLCWPYFADQFHNRNYICNVWKIGLRLDLGEDGIILRNEIKDKIGRLLCDYGIRENSLKLKETARNSISEIGSSKRNLECFIDQIKN
ncbi:UDP-glucuronosyl/UDP-glucosyltransferase [Dillenia turbinata]|uniref:UDP-glucuronosyl/UDP-glucosyltransferase n=1 Tax=Dillenia turbinata TaxID=194707 RepID=A0AAN8V9A6_9MAGN